MSKLEEKNKTLLKHSATLKTHALQLFDGQESCHAIYALIHAASRIIKDEKTNYNQAVYGALTILMHLEECTGCEEHKESEDD